MRAPIRLLGLALVLSVVHAASALAQTLPPGQGQPPGTPQSATQDQPTGITQGTTFVPSMSVGAGYDDNVFWSPTPVSDQIWRVTPGFGVDQESPRVSWMSLYHFDAERYRTNAALTTPMARQTGSSDLHFMESAATTLVAMGGYDSTSTPGDLNLTTALAIPRSSASRWYGDASLTHETGPRTALDVAYHVSRDSASIGEDVTTQGVDFGVTRKVASRNAATFSVLGRHFTFDGIDGTRSDLSSIATVFGWTNRITPHTSWTLRAGPRLEGGSAHLELAAVVRHQGTGSDVSVEYDSTQTTALGLTGPVDERRAIATVAYHLPARMDATLQGGVYSSQFAGLTARVYRAAATVTKHLSDSVLLSLDYALDVQKGLLGVPQEVILPSDTAVAPVSFASSASVQRNLILMRVMIAPTIRRRPEPPKTLAPDGHAPAPDESEKPNLPDIKGAKP